MINYEKEIDNILNSKRLNSSEKNLKNRRIILYGAGAMGEMALDFLELINITPKYIVDAYKKGKVRGINIVHPKDISKNDLKNSTCLLCVVTTPISPIIDYLKKFDYTDIRHFYDYSEIMLKNRLTNGWTCFNPITKDINAITKVCEYLEQDKHSLAHYLQFLWWRIRRVEKIDIEYPVLSNQKYFNAPCIPKLSRNESFLDGGAHFGSTTKNFLDTIDMQFDNIWAVEPDEKNLLGMKAKFFDMNNIEYLNIALSNIDSKNNFIDGLGFASKIEKNGNKIIQTLKIDSLNINPTIIKLHLEGHELQALEGAKETIKRTRPILMVLADHNKDGLYKIAQFLTKLDRYKIYFYLHDYCGNSAIYYAIPKERGNDER